MSYWFKDNWSVGNWYQDNWWQGVPVPVPVPVAVGGSGSWSAGYAPIHPRQWPPPDYDKARETLKDRISDAFKKGKKHPENFISAQLRKDEAQRQLKESISKRDLSGLRAQIDQVKDRILELEDHRVKLSEQLINQGSYARVMAVESELGELKLHLQKVEKAVKDVSVTIADEFSQNEARLAEVSRKFDDAAKAQIDIAHSIEKKVSSQAEKLESLEHKIDALMEVPEVEYRPRLPRALMAGAPYFTVSIVLGVATNKLIPAKIGKGRQKRSNPAQFLSYTAAFIAGAIGTQKFLQEIGKP